MNKRQVDTILAGNGSIDMARDCFLEVGKALADFQGVDLGFRVDPKGSYARYEVAAFRWPATRVGKPTIVFSRTMLRNLFTRGLTAEQVALPLEREHFVREFGNRKVDGFAAIWFVLMHEMAHALQMDHVRQNRLPMPKGDGHDTLFFRCLNDLHELFPDWTEFVECHLVY